jgi:hypothetical protein
MCRIAACDQGARKVDLARRDAYVLAAAPAMLFLGVYAYERGRYYYLRVAPDFIDISVNRLLAGGAMVGVLSIMLVGLTLWMWNYSSSRGKNAKWIAASLAAMVFLALPTALWVERLPRVSVGSGPLASYAPLISDIASVLAAIVGTFVVHEARRVADRLRIAKAARKQADPRRQAKSDNAKHTGGATSGGTRNGEVAKSRDDDVASSSGDDDVASSGKLERLTPLVPWTLLQGIALFIWTASVFAGLGYRVERSSTTRLCAADYFVADVHGDNLLLKSFDHKTGEILSPVKVMEAKDTELDWCSPQLIGAKGLTLWDQGVE